jgi:hypothetical protein
MKRIYILFTVLLMSGMASAQDGPKNSLKLNPLSAAFGGVNLSYQRAVSEKSSLQLVTNYSSFKFTSTSYSGFGLTPEYRFQLGKNATALRGIYVGPYARYSSYKVEDTELESKASMTSIGGGVVFGYQYVSRGGFTLDLFIGPGYSSNKFKVESGNEENFNDGFGVANGFGFARTGITIGYSF